MIKRFFILIISYLSFSSLYLNHAEEPSGDPVQDESAVSISINEKIVPLPEYCRENNRVDFIPLQDGLLIREPDKRTVLFDTNGKVRFETNRASNLEVYSNNGKFQGCSMWEEKGSFVILSTAMDRQFEVKARGECDLADLSDSFTRKINGLISRLDDDNPAVQETVGTSLLSIGKPILQKYLEKAED